MSMQDLIEQGIECGADANEISNVLFSNGFGKTETLQQKINELQLSLDLEWEAGQRAIKMWQAETGKELVWPDKADLCVWLMQQNEQLQATNQQLLEALHIGAHWMEWWINTAECECEYSHTCGYNERKAELEQMQKALTNAKQLEGN